METTELFSKMINGKLSPEAQNELFGMLAADPELQAEFKAFASLTSGINANLPGLAPSNDAKSRIFAKSGMKMPGTPADPAPKPKLLKTGLLSGIASSVATVLIMLWLLGGSNTPGNIENYAFPQNNIGQVNLRMEYPTKKANKKPKIQYVYIEKEVENRISDSDRKIRNTNDKPISILFESQNDLMKPTPIEINQADLPGRMRLMPIVPEFDLGSRFSAEITASAYRSIPMPEITPSHFAQLNNFGVKLLYMLNKDLEIGAELRQETFYNEYRGYEEDGSLYLYKQNANFTSYGGLIRYNFADFENFEPFVQLIAGGNESGVILRPALALEFRASDWLRFNAGLEYSMFYFQHQNNWFNSSKIGIFYGITLGM